MNELSQAILQTINYFDVFEYPLTSWEVKKFLWNYAGRATQTDIEKQLNLFADNKILGTIEGFYFLPGKAKLVEVRKQNYLQGQEKMKIALKYAKLISKLPFVKTIFITNKLSYLNAAPASDLDLAIITSKNRIWTARLFATGFLKLLGKRPKPNNQQNKVCLSFYITEDKLSLEAAAYEHDIHFQYWVKQWLPIYDAGNYANEFFMANGWIDKNLQNFFETKTSARWQIKKNSAHKKLFETLLGKWFETLAKNLQIKIMPKQLKTLAEEPNSNVIISNELLKFHDKDRRMEYKLAWENKNKNL